MTSNGVRTLCFSPIYFGSPKAFLKLKGYRLGHVIGEGSFSKVRVAEHDGKPLAIKIISKMNSNTKYTEQFLPRELAALINLSHRNITTIYHIADCRDQVFVLMELAEKGDLSHYIKEKHHLLEDEAKMFFRQMAEAVQYIHNLNISHRDLKCANILITENNIIKLTDFSLCRYCVDPNTRHKILSSTYCGSSAYAAPEILMGIPYFPKGSDIWSLGCILFVMVTGTLPFNDCSVNEIVHNQNARRYFYPEVVIAIISKECKQLISRMLEPDYSNRITIGNIVRSQWLR